MVLPGHALHSEMQAIRYKLLRWLGARITGYQYEPLLNQTRTNTPRTEALGEKNFLQLHLYICHPMIVAAAHWEAAPFTLNRNPPNGLQTASSQRSQEFFRLQANTKYQ